MAVGERVIEAYNNTNDKPIDVPPGTTMPPELVSTEPIPSLTISLMGMANFGAMAYERLKLQGHNINVVYALDNPRDPLRAAVEKDNEGRDENDKIKLYSLSKEELEKEGAADKFATEDTDLGVFASMTEMVSEEFFKKPRLGVIGMHDSYLPEGRGGSAGNNAIIKGKKESGISIYMVDEGRDTGDILLQAKTEVRDTDTTASLFKRYTPLGVDLLSNSVELIARGQDHLIRKVQDKSIDTEEDYIGKSPVNWNMSAIDVYNFLRGAANKDPYAEKKPNDDINLNEYFDLPRNIYNLSDVALLPDRIYNFTKPGTIIDINDEGAVIVAGRGAVRIGKFQKSRFRKGTETGRLFEIKRENRGPRESAIKLAISGELSVGEEFALRS